MWIGGKYYYIFEFTLRSGMDLILGMSKMLKCWGLGINTETSFVINGPNTNQVELSRNWGKIKAVRTAEYFFIGGPK